MWGLHKHRSLPSLSLLPVRIASVDTNLCSTVTHCREPSSQTKKRCERATNREPVLLAFARVEQLGNAPQHQPLVYALAVCCGRRRCCCWRARTSESCRRHGLLCPHVELHKEAAQLDVGDCISHTHKNTLGLLPVVTLRFGFAVGPNSSWSPSCPRAPRWSAHRCGCPSSLAGALGRSGSFFSSQNRLPSAVLLTVPKLKFM